MAVALMEPAGMNAGIVAVAVTLEVIAVIVVTVAIAAVIIVIIIAIAAVTPAGIIAVDVIGDAINARLVAMSFQYF